MTCPRPRQGKSISRESVAWDLGVPIRPDAVAFFGVEMNAITPTIHIAYEQYRQDVLVGNGVGK